MNVMIDDLGYEWVYDPQRGDIRMPESDALTDGEHNGYYCESFAHGVDLIAGYGYISPWYARQQMQSQPAAIGCPTPDLSAMWFSVLCAACTHSSWWW